MHTPPKTVIALLGCTASGKAAVARLIAPRLGAEIVSIDSMKVYRGMDVGTAKPSLEHRAATPHHLIDIVDPWEFFSAARYVELADAAIDDIHRRGKPALVVGGTMLYFKSLYEGLFDGPQANAQIRDEIRSRAAANGAEALHAELAAVDPPAAARIHRNDLRRIERALEVFHLTGTPISSLQRQWTNPAVRRTDWTWRAFALRRDRESANRRINERVRRMLAAGLVDEARKLWTDSRGMSTQARQAVGYAELFDHFHGRLSLDEAVERIKINSRHLAKHQRTWLRRMPTVHSIDVTDNDDPLTIANAVNQLLHEGAANGNAQSETRTQGA